MVICLCALLVILCRDGGGRCGCFFVAWACGLCCLWVSLLGYGWYNSAYLFRLLLCWVTGEVSEWVMLVPEPHCSVHCHPPLTATVG